MNESRTIGAFDAKTHLSELLERVSRGESFVITRRGVPVARLTPAESVAAAPSRDELLAQARQLRASVGASAAEIRSWVDEGRQ